MIMISVKYIIIKMKGLANSSVTVQDTLDEMLEDTVDALNWEDDD